MKRDVLLTALPAAFSLMVMLLGLHLDRLWGVNPGRMTPAREREKDRNALALLAGYLLALSAFALPCASAAAAEYGLETALAGVGIVSVCGGVIGYAAMFVALRHGGEGFGSAAETETGAAAQKIYDLLTLGMAVCTAARLIAALPVFSAAGKNPLPLCDAAILLGLLAVLPPAFFSGSVGNEAQGGPLSMGGSLAAGLTAICAAAASQMGAAQAFAWTGIRADMLQRAFAVASAAADICLFASCVCLAGAGLRALAGRSLPGRKKPSALKKSAPYAAACLLCAAASFAGEEALGMVGAVCAMILAAETAVICAIWFRRIGRRMI